MDEVFVGLKSLLEVKKVEREVFFVSTFGPMNMGSYPVNLLLIYLLMIVIQLFKFLSFLSILVVCFREFRQFTNFSSGWVRKLLENMSMYLVL